MLHEALIMKRLQQHLNGKRDRCFWRSNWYD